MRFVAFLREYGIVYLIAVVFGLWCGALGLGEIESYSPLSNVVLPWGLATCASMWTCLDARLRRRTPCFDFGWFIFSTWMVSVPGYLIATRGWRSLLILLTAVVTYFATTAAVIVVLGIH